MQLGDAREPVRVRVQQIVQSLPNVYAFSQIAQLLLDRLELGQNNLILRRERDELPPEHHQALVHRYELRRELAQTLLQRIQDLV